MKDKEGEEVSIIEEYKVSMEFKDWLWIYKSIPMNDYVHFPYGKKKLLCMQFKYKDKVKGTNMEPEIEKFNPKDPKVFIKDILDTIDKEVEETKDQKESLVTEPNHYTMHTIEPCTFVMKNNLSFAIGNVVKYVTRAGFKKYDDLTLQQSHIRDLEKARRYIDMEINLLEGKEKL